MIVTPKTPQSYTKSYVKAKEDQGVLAVVDFLPQSPDLNPTEHLWGHLRTERAKNSVTLPETLWNIVESCRDIMGHQVLHKLVGSGS